MQEDNPNTESGSSSENTNGSSPTSPPNFNEYLGDGLYVDFDGYHVKLYAHNGAYVHDAVYLDPEVLTNFLKYANNRLEMRV